MFGRTLPPNGSGFYPLTANVLRCDDSCCSSMGPGVEAMVAYYWDKLPLRSMPGLWGCRECFRRLPRLPRLPRLQDLDDVWRWLFASGYSFGGGLGRDRERLLLLWPGREWLLLLRRKGREGPKTKVLA